MPLARGFKTENRVRYDKLIDGFFIFYNSLHSFNLHENADFIKIVSKHKPTSIINH